jgi:L-serine dehydratase
MFLDLVRRNHSLQDVKSFVEFFGSLAKTGVGHGTDIAGMLGLSGENFRTIDTNKIDEKIEKIKSKKSILEEKSVCRLSTDII